MLLDYVRYDGVIKEKLIKKECLFYTLTFHYFANTLFAEMHTFPHKETQICNIDFYILN